MLNWNKKKKNKCANISAAIETLENQESNTKLLVATWVTHFSIHKNK